MRKNRMSRPKRQASPSSSRPSGSSSGSHSNSQTNSQSLSSSSQSHLQPDETQYKKAVSNVKCMLQAAGVGKSTDPLSERSRRLARELEDFVGRGMHQIMATEIGEEGAPSVEAATELQIQIARMFRQV